MHNIEIWTKNIKEPCFLAKSSVANWAIFQSAMFAEVFGYPLDGPKDDDHGGWMPTEALAAQKKKRRGDESEIKCPVFGMNSDEHPHFFY